MRAYNAFVHENRTAQYMMGSYEGTVFQLARFVPIQNRIQLASVRIRYQGESRQTERSALDRLTNDAVEKSIEERRYPLDVIFNRCIEFITEFPLHGFPQLVDQGTDVEDWHDVVADRHAQEPALQLRVTDRMENPVERYRCGCRSRVEGVVQGVVQGREGTAQRRRGLRKLVDLSSSRAGMGGDDN